MPQKTHKQSTKAFQLFNLWPQLPESLAPAQKTSSKSFFFLKIWIRTVNLWSLWSHLTVQTLQDEWETLKRKRVLRAIVLGWQALEGHVHMHSTENKTSQLNTAQKYYWRYYVNLTWIVFFLINLIPFFSALFSVENFIKKRPLCLKEKKKSHSLDCLFYFLAA